MRRRNVASTSVRCRYDVMSLLGIRPSWSPQYSKPWPSPNILNLPPPPPPQYSKPPYAYKNDSFSGEKQLCYFDFCLSSQYGQLIMERIDLILEGLRRPGKKTIIKVVPLRDIVGKNMELFPYTFTFFQRYNAQNL